MVNCLLMMPFKYHFFNIPLFIKLPPQVLLQKWNVCMRLSYIKQTRDLVLQLWSRVCTNFNTIIVLILGIYNGFSLC